MAFVHWCHVRDADGAEEATIYDSTNHPPRHTLCHGVHGVHALDEADITADIVAGDRAIRCLLKGFIQGVADFLCENTGGTTLSRYDIETAWAELRCNIAIIVHYVLNKNIVRIRCSTPTAWDYYWPRRPNSSQHLYVWKCRMSNKSATSSA